MANIILKLLDEQYVLNLLKEKVLPLYPDFIDIKKTKIIPRKKHIWDHTYHVVIEFETIFLTKRKKEKKLSIYIAAHSNEPRKNVYDGLNFLWKHNFNKGYLTIPHPLFYSDKFKGTFYRGVDGHHLYYYIRKKDYKNIEDIVIKTAAWFAKLHKLTTKDAKNFNEENSRIKTAIPGAGHILNKIHDKYPEHYKACKNAYSEVIRQEEDFLSSTEKRWLVHGDAHPENIIKINDKKIAAIDFSDLCLSDFARDIGSFLQQIEYMCDRKINDEKFSEKIKNIFLESYLKNAKIELNKDLQKRINTYYNWTALRTATFFLIKDKPEPDRAKYLLDTISKNIKIKSPPCL